AASVAFRTLTGAPVGPIGSCVHRTPFLQSSVPGAYRLNVQLPGASRFTVRLGPVPSLPPTRQMRPSATGVTSMPSALASRATAADQQHGGGDGDDGEPRPPPTGLPVLRVVGTLRRGGHRLGLPRALDTLLGPGVPGVLGVLGALGALGVLHALGVLGALGVLA